MKARLAFPAVAVLALSASVCIADIIVTPKSSGLNTLAVSPGDNFNLDLMTMGTGSIDSAVFTIELSKPGLRLIGYAWGGGFNGSAFDGSVPAGSSLPVLIDANTYHTPGPTEKTDLY